MLVSRKVILLLTADRQSMASSAPWPSRTWDSWFSLSMRSILRPILHNSTESWTLKQGGGDLAWLCAFTLVRPEAVPLLRFVSSSSPSDSFSMCQMWKSLCQTWLRCARHQTSWGKLRCCISKRHSASILCSPKPLGQSQAATSISAFAVFLFRLDPSSRDAIIVLMQCHQSSVFIQALFPEECTLCWQMLVLPARQTDEHRS